MLMHKSAAGLATIQSLTLTLDLSIAKTSASAIDLTTVPYQNHADDTDADFGDVLTDMNGAVPTPGDHTAPSSPMKYVFFVFLVSDGVGDRVNGSPGCPHPVTKGSDPQTMRTSEPPRAYGYPILNRLPG